MSQPTTLARRYTAAWHAAEAAEERSWLDQWARLHLITTTEISSTPAPERLLVPDGRR
jgi:hypothetical protein